MSWFSDNYHKVALAGGIIIAAGLGVTAYSSSQKMKANFEASSSTPKGDLAILSPDMPANLSKSVTDGRTLEEKRYLDRPVNLLTSVSLAVHKNDRENPKDLLKDANVHADIPNIWWIEHNIDPGFSDSPQRDEDGDGYSNLEEFVAKTSPTNPADHPSLLNKLAVSKVDIYEFRVFLNSIYGDGRYQFAYEAHDTKTKKDSNNRMSADQTADIGDVFFAKEPAKGRFKLLKIEDKPGRNGLARQWASLEDQQGNKKGTIYVVPYRLTAQERQNREFINYDYTITFSLQAVGEESNVFEVKENETFGLPAGNEKKQYRLIGVNGDKKTGKATSVIVEYTNDKGEKTKRKIPVSAQ